MTVRSQPVGRRARPARRTARKRQPSRVKGLLRHAPKIILVVVIAMLVARAVNVVPRLVQNALPGYTPIAPLFTKEIQHWRMDIERWAAAYDLDPNLLATVMQIESCGHPTISSSAGAQGLFQVMPFHFSANENQIDPETNARRGASFLEQCLTRWGKNDPGLALACYNGGPSLTNKPYTAWPNQTQRYFIWGLGIYTDASSNQSSSQTLDTWLNAGGRTLCQMASREMGLQAG
jgi:soluble lytic murein transglycosylase-like protein